MFEIKNPQPNRKVVFLIALLPFAETGAADKRHTEVEQHWIVGHISDQSGQPVADAFVEIAPRRFETGRSKAWCQSTVSNAFGRFAFPKAIPDLEYTLRARKTGHQEVYTEVNFENRSSVSVELNAQKTRSLTGRITNSQNENAPVDANVTLVGGRVHSYQRTVNADAEGRFAFDDVPIDIGQATIWAAKGNDASDYVVIRSTTNNVDLSLDTAGALSGHIRTNLGNPISGCEVILRHSTMSGYRGSATSDHVGRFRFADLPMGEYVVSAVHSEWFEPFADFSRRQEVRVVAGQEKACQIVMYKKALINGRVVDGNDQPIKDATVFAETAAIDRESRYHIVESVLDGSFTLRTGCFDRSHGYLEVVALHPKFGMGKIRWNGPSAASVPVIKLNGTMRIRGQVADIDQVPVEDAFVGLPGGWLSTNREGRFRSSVIPIPNASGLTSLHVTSARPDNGGVSFFSWSSRTRTARLPKASSRFFLDKTITISTVHDSQLDLNIVLEPAKVVRIHGGVVDKENKPIPGGLAIVILGNAPDDWLELLHPNPRRGGTFGSRNYVPLGRTVIDDSGRFAIAIMRETAESIAVIAPYLKNVNTTVFSVGVETPSGKTKLEKGIKFEKSRVMALRIDVP